LLTSLGGYYGAATVFTAGTLALWGLLGGALLGCLILMIEKKVAELAWWVLSGAVFGLVGGLVIANLLTRAFFVGGGQLPGVMLPLCVLAYVCLGYLGLAAGMKKAQELNPGRLKIFSKAGAPEENYKILDTSVIIDGRIFDICETGFIEGTFVIPQFVLQELMKIADSSDPLRRTRGRKGLDTLKKIQNQTDFNVIITDQDFPKIREVDHKLVALAHKLGGKILTNDVNLNEIAEIQGVTVLNVNQLAAALRPIVLPGEAMTVYVQKEGKEQGQGVAYLDDGTMVVIKDGKKIIGKTVEAVVTSVLQTTAGRMIFAEGKEDSRHQNLHRLK
jgi:uncharacterized protein YacL